MSTTVDVVIVIGGTPSSEPDRTVVVSVGSLGTNEDSGRLGTLDRT